MCTANSTSNIKIVFKGGITDKKRDKMELQNLRLIPEKAGKKGGKEEQRTNTMNRKQLQMVNTFASCIFG